MSSFYNEMGEPLMSPEGMRAEMNAQHDPMDNWCGDCGVTHGANVACDSGCDECGFYGYPYREWSGDGVELLCNECYECRCTDEARKAHW